MIAHWLPRTNRPSEAQTSRWNSVGAAIEFQPNHGKTL